ncbi:AMP-binding protein [Tropicimonas isoalkanivorans]|uniref:AMP-binding protein n=1 Tax=Tropicimonas isoalkanivorans TaxID=441112 RepID=UPI001C4362C0|nr:AMP-binding protein [Tropicimonas isoalkanivorans]
MRIGAQSRSGDDIRARAQSLAEALATLGVGAGDAVAHLAPNGFSHFEVELAMRALDGFVVPLNWHMAPPEIEYILYDCAAKALVGTGSLLDSVGDALAPHVRRISLSPETGSARLDYETLVRTPVSQTRKGRGLESSIIYTSGTTGKPKGVRRLPQNQREIDARAAALRVLYPSRPGARALVTGPQYHLFSLAVSMTYFGAGASVTVMERFDAEEFLSLVERHQITHTHLVPTMMVRLMRLPAEVRNRYDTTSLEFLIHSGSACAEDVKRAMIDWLGPVIWESYGGTETGALTMIGPEDWLSRPGSVGRPFATGEVRIHGEADEPLPPGAVGQVYGVMRGTPDFTYHGDPEKRAAAGLDGRFATGDLGWLDDDGFLYICDRMVEKLISGGVNIYPAEIEAAILSHPLVVDAAVIGIPDPEFGESVCAHVTTTEPMSQDELRTHLRSRIAGFKIPRLIVFDDDLPRLENGKILKRALRDAYRTGTWKAP